MKKLLSLATMALLLCVAACQNNGYKITGTINGGQDGDTVVLMGLKNDTLSTTVIKDGKFVLTGVQDTAQMCYVLWKSNETPDQIIGAAIALENADITLKMDTTANVPSEVSGTPANDALSALNKQEQALNEKATSIFAVLGDIMATDEAKAAAGKQMEELQDEAAAIYQKFVAENIQNIAGQTYLAQYASLFDDAFVIEQLAALPEAALTEQLTKLKENYDVKAATAVGQPFKDFKATTPEDAELAVSEVAKDAKVLMIDFWASWCGPCRAEMPNVKAAYDQYHAQGFEIIGVSLDNDADAWKQAIADLGMTWPQISDLKGWECEGAGIYGVRAIPATVLIKDGVIVARDLRGDKLTEKVGELIK